MKCNGLWSLIPGCSGYFLTAFFQNRYWSAITSFGDEECIIKWRYFTRKSAESSRSRTPELFEKGLIGTMTQCCSTLCSSILLLLGFPRERNGTQPTAIYLQVFTHKRLFFSNNMLHSTPSTSTSWSSQTERERKQILNSITNTFRILDTGFIQYDTLHFPTMHITFFFFKCLFFLLLKISKQFPSLSWWRLVCFNLHQATLVKR